MNMKTRNSSTRTTSQLRVRGVRAWGVRARSARVSMFSLFHILLCHSWRKLKHQHRHIIKLARSCNRVEFVHVVLRAKFQQYYTRTTFHQSTQSNLSSSVCIAYLSISTTHKTCCNTGHAETSCRHGRNTSSSSSSSCCVCNDHILLRKHRTWHVSIHSYRSLLWVVRQHTHIFIHTTHGIWRERCDIMVWFEKRVTLWFLCSFSANHVYRSKFR